MLLARVTVAFVAALLVAGCGGDEPVTAVHGRRLTVELDEFLIRPQAVTARPGRLTLTIVDRGRLRHSFRLWGPGGEPVRVTTLFPGDEAVRRARLAPGRYRMVCTVSNHAELGMTGILTVR
jgi:plastocyanin